MNTIDPTALMQDALLEIERLQHKLGKFEQQRHEPIAVIGMGCRFAGANSPDDLWRLLLDGTDGVREVPPDRWDAERYFDADPDAAGRIYCRAGSFLDDIASFDAGFFGISAREAVMLDPQQRMLLEVAWEALERAGMPASALKGTATGMFAGVMHQDYAHRFRRAADVDLYTAAGNAPSVLAGRVSHVLGLHGPSLTIDTACSSSLVAVHLACNALRARECDIAIVGGVNVVLSPLSTAAECRAHMLSPSGRCRSFDDGADGFVRGEGCGVVVLQRLGDAQAAGRTIDALIAGSAVNHDGRSAGLTVPNEHAQRELVRGALRAARLDASQVRYVEAHGTGTALGDPIEAAALASVFAGRAKDARVLLGSIKSNFGHLEGAAGIAGLIKAILAVRHGVVPATLHVTQPNRGIDWDNLPLRLALRNERIDLDGGPCIAGVSSFGFSGTNAHALVVAPPRVEQAAPPDDRPGLQLLTVSAKSDASLRANVARYADYLTGLDARAFAAACHASRVARSHFPHRLAVVAASADDMARELHRFARGEDAAVSAGVCGAMPLDREPSSDLAGGANGLDLLPSLAQRYVAGLPVDWAALGGADRRLAPLPTYAFERQRYWVDERAVGAPSQLFRIAWQPASTPALARRTGARIVAGDPALRAEVARALEAAGECCSIVAADADAILQAGPAGLGVVLAFDGAVQDGEPVEAVACRGALVGALARRLAAAPAAGPVTLVTRGSVATGPAEDVDPVVAAMNAAVRVARREQGRAWRGTIDVDGSAASFATLAALLGGDAEEEQMAVRGATVLVPRLRYAGAGAAGEVPALDGDAAYVVTGGTGALGLATARWLAGRGARHLLLISRRGEVGDGVRATCERLRGDGVDVRVVASDVADEASLRGALAAAARPIRGVVHCAGIVQDAPLATLDAAAFANVLRAKVGGAALLDRLTDAQPLDFFLLYSSISVAVGRHGQAAYAAANAYLDALAQRRRVRARPALSIGWGLWASGMGAADAKTAERVRSSGLHPLAEAEAFASLEQAFAGEPHMIVAAIDIDRIAAQPDLPRAIEGITGRAQAPRARAFDIEQLRGRPAAARRALIAGHLDAELRAVLSSASALSHQASLIELGVDSLTGSELRNAIERSMGVSVSISNLIDGSSLDAVIETVAAQIERRLVTEHSSTTGAETEEITL
ncbi:SDR family NAD(P)-dependent oxidoreductase [Burkholderia thailandensis]|uniref:CurJ n=1 Tax=Burkholderia thailandensis TaxID=57975 RepID=A0AAW9D6S0_BURTH|nr:SDR family NAD(P)-dependent oxidoreductase [Burkholderia thailandensis]AHI64739.1 short chain dehydrogenase family protein [Burkholderia thailandensis H0587]AOJ50928.1 polyketide synthase [Burkholderia thailandensis]AVR26355.1 KR domain-containing protein [Burkholderia thailandensis]MCS3391510.1 SDR family NAD(P)-dependent oxidoreductase [Burkholderia thailandensis]MCS6423782.1 SDR family NAD(P)-dependent oxidoreductase [Burkholderia thailandensis]